MKSSVIHPVEQGPWGRKGGSGPSGGNGGGGGWNPNNGRGRGPGNSGDFEDLLRDMKRYLQTFFGQDGGHRNIVFVFGVFFLLWLASGFYTVQPGEQGVVQRFGKFNRLATSGLNYRWPAPFEAVDIVNTEMVRIESLGSESAPSSKMTSSGITVNSQEILMLTGDENIIDLTFNVQWNVRDAQDFVFNIPNPQQTVSAVTESAMREVVGRTPIGAALTGGKSKLQEETQKLTQETLDRYKSGIQVLQVNLIRASFPQAVVDAARDVQAARADQERLRNEADAYKNDIIPRARGQAQRMIQDAEGYKSEVVARAEGDAARFVSVYTQYRQAEDITRRRMYLETMEKVLSGMNKMVLDNKTGTTPYLPLPALAPASRNDDKKEAK